MLDQPSASGSIVDEGSGCETDDAIATKRAGRDCRRFWLMVVLRACRVVLAPTLNNADVKCQECEVKSGQV